MSVREQIANLLAEELATAALATKPLTGWGDALADRILEIVEAGS